MLLLHRVKVVHDCNWYTECGFILTFKERKSKLAKTETKANKDKTKKEKVLSRILERWLK